MKQENLRLVTINTSAWSEEDFALLTDLSDAKIKKVISPMVRQERNDDFVYSNEDYYWSLKEAYASNIVIMYNLDDIDSISF